ncbi:hypothetical protein LSAT2_015623 [Lamellibrachia satsuma]|nr:hypothetical protein LSAT2_015623 [Lamellibrachia satsuma]
MMPHAHVGINVSSHVPDRDNMLDGSTTNHNILRLYTFPQEKSVVCHHTLCLVISWLEFMLKHPASDLIDAVTKGLNNARQITSI